MLGSGWVGVQRICSRIVAMSSLGLSSALSRMALNLVVCSRTSARRCSRVDMIVCLKGNDQYSHVLSLAGMREVLLGVSARRLVVSRLLIKTQALLEESNCLCFVVSMLSAYKGFESSPSRTIEAGLTAYARLCKDGAMIFVEYL